MESGRYIRMGAHFGMTVEDTHLLLAMYCYSLWSICEHDQQRCHILPRNHINPRSFLDCLGRTFIASNRSR